VLPRQAVIHDGQNLGWGQKCTQCLGPRQVTQSDNQTMSRDMWQLVNGCGKRLRLDVCCT
jgi:hypothetical protein